MSFKNKLKTILSRLKKSGISNINKLWTIFIFASVFLLMIFSVYNEWETFVTFEWQLNWSFLIVMILLHSLAQGALFGGWYLILGKLVIRDQWLADFRIFNLSILARRIPLPIWYIGSRFHLYQQVHVSSSAVLTATGLEILLISISGLVCFVILLPWYAFTQNWPWQIFVLVTFFFSLILILRPGLLVELVNIVLRRLKRPTIPETIKRADILIIGSIYLTVWFLDGLGFYFLTAALIQNPPAVASMVGISTIAALIAILSMALPGGFGLKEITMSAMLSLWIPLSAGLLISIIYRFAQTFIEMFWAYFSNWVYKIRFNKPD